MKGLSMDGILLIDKPRDMTSFDVIRRLKKQLNIKKIGHAGTLDPFANGLLVILLGKATRLSDLLLNEDKTYLTTITFGTHTNTYDITGEVILENQKTVSYKDIIDVLDSMKTYEQEPPMFSALKVNGKKLYELARQDIMVEREKRWVHIFDYHVHNFSYPELLVTLHVSKGTYIRSIAVDLAKRLETFAHVSNLRRIQSGTLSIENAHKLDSVTQDDIIPLHTILNMYPKIVVTDFIASKVKQGLTMDERQYQKQEMFVVCNKEGDIIALYKPIGETLYKPVIILLS
jgi:tRNA pseudouridine55 synthase